MQNILIDEEMGNVLKTKEVAKLLGVDRKYVRKHYLELGGKQIGKLYIFTERGLANAVLQQKEEKMGRESKEKKKWEGTQDGKNMPDKKGGTRMGIYDEKKTNRRLVQGDKHNLFR